MNDFSGADPPVAPPDGDQQAAPSAGATTPADPGERLGAWRPMVAVRAAMKALGHNAKVKEILAWLDREYPDHPPMTVDQARSMRWQLRKKEGQRVAKGPAPGLEPALNTLLSIKQDVENRGLTVDGFLAQVESVESLAQKVGSLPALKSVLRTLSNLSRINLSPPEEENEKP